MIEDNSSDPKTGRVGHSLEGVAMDVHVVGRGS